MAGKPVSAVGSGGMLTKLEAARIALPAGANMVIASGRVPNPLQRLADGAPCTWFLTTASPVAARKRWIGGALVPMGQLIIDAGAANALSARQKPSAGRGQTDRGTVRAWRCGIDCDRRRSGSRPRARRL